MQVECAGPARVLLQYSEARRQEDMVARLEGNRRDWEASEAALLAPPPRSAVVAATSLTNTAHSVLRLYERDLGSPGRCGPHRALALALFYQVADSVTEDWLACPALRHAVSDLLELVAGVVVSSPAHRQAPRLLHALTSAPHLAPLLSPHFCPNTADPREVTELYRAVCALPDSDTELPFVLLSKLDLAGWLSDCAPPAPAVSAVLASLTTALGRTGLEVEAGRALLHGLHRRHLSTLAPHCHTHQLLPGLLSLTAQNRLDPAVWPDLLSSLTACPGRFSLDHQTHQERLAAVTEFVNTASQAELQVLGRFVFCTFCGQSCS